MRMIMVRPAMTVTVELVGLEVFGRHGVDDDEREQGRTFLYDVALEVAAPASDRLEDTVDYRAVAACVREVSEAREYRLIEVLASAVADELATRFSVERIRVRVRKPGISPAGLTVAYSAATAERGP
jgi:7,8-dihydroneopterin aldolase/epimerase/oxygenase